MRRLGLLVAAIGLLLAGRAEAALSVGAVLSCSNSGSTTCTTPSATTSGSLLIAQTGYWLAGGAFTSITDSKSNTWTNVLTTTGANEVLRADAATTAASGASHTFTLTTASGFYGTLSVLEVRGATAAPGDQTATGLDSVGATTHTTAATPTTSQANEILVGMGVSTTITTFTQTGSGWTEATNVPSTVSDTGGVAGYRIVAATGAYVYTYTTSAASTTVQQTTTWKEAAVAAGVRQQCVGCGVDRKGLE